ncbi:MAG TPA: hypothetical protein VK158_00385 [Acidobacteriota bacterium]|nr:hypothetical protein [Acidobacteriota bacterium]
MRQKKRGFFFVLDTIFAVVVILAGLILVFTNLSSVPATYQAASSSIDVLSQLSKTKVNETANAYILALRFNNTLTKSDNYRSIIDVVAYLYNRSNTYDARGVIESFVENVTPENYNIEILINDTLLYEKSVKDITQENAAFVIKTRGIVIGVTNDSNMIGPYIMEISLW